MTVPSVCFGLWENYRTKIVNDLVTQILADGAVLHECGYSEIPPKVTRRCLLVHLFLFVCLSPCRSFLGPTCGGIMINYLSFGNAAAVSRLGGPWSPVVHSLTAVVLSHSRFWPVLWRFRWDPLISFHFTCILHAVPIKHNTAYHLQPGP